MFHRFQVMTKTLFSKSNVIGRTLERQIEVGPDRVITFMGDDLKVYETPSMIADIEYACRDLLVECLMDGWDSVGVVVNIDHLAATPMNEFVKIKVAVDDIIDRTVLFSCEVVDSVELVGKGTHKRYIVNVERHRQRVLEKRAALHKSDTSP